MQCSTNITGYKLPECPLNFEELNEAILLPCSHRINETSLACFKDKTQQHCPQCQQPFENYKVDQQFRDLIKATQDLNKKLEEQNQEIVQLKAQILSQSSTSNQPRNNPEIEYVRALMQEEKFEEAYVEYLKLKTSKNPETAKYCADFIIQIMEKAEIFIKNKQLSEALACLNIWVRLSHRSAQAHVFRALVRKELNQDTEAFDDLNDAFKVSIQGSLSRAEQYDSFTGQRSAAKNYVEANTKPRRNFWAD